MTDLFLQILDMSITACYVIAFVILVRLLLQKAPRVFSYILWGAVLFRLVCPVSFNGLISLVPSGLARPELSPWLDDYTGNIHIYESVAPEYQGLIESGFVPVESGSIITAGDGFSPPPTVETTLLPVLAWVWLAGVALLLLYSAFTAIRLSRRLRGAERLSGNIYTMEGLQTAFVFGLIKPKIYLPAGLSQQEQEYIVLHEETHIRRGDHIIKSLAFLVLCVHWFNPLAWVAFFLMGKDMEVSCDQRVLRQMGDQVKKDYASSLLTLSTGRPIVGGCPLAFGENDTKGRIKNVLSYKKPAFWVILAALAAVVVLCVGLISDPAAEALTVEDYANEYVEEQISYLDGTVAGPITEGKITVLEQLAVIEGMLEDPVILWQLEYRLLPENFDEAVLAGGMNAEDGWITEDSSMGKPYLVFSGEPGALEYLGVIWSGEGDFSTLAGQETALRGFLEGRGLLPGETYGEPHAIAEFKLSTGETSQLLLSQPATKGSAGIWCVERWMDGTGNLYYVTPETEGSTAAYYEALQAECDQGHKPWLLTPEDVAIEYIREDLGQPFPMDQLVLRRDATFEDFLETPVSEFFGYITQFKREDNFFHLDRAEWLTEPEDLDRLTELGIAPDSLPNGFYIYNPATYPDYFGVNEDTRYAVVNWALSSTEEVSKDEFITYLEGFEDSAPPFWVTTKDGYVLSVEGQYVP